MPIERLSSFSWQNASFKSIIRALEKCVPNLRRRISLPCWRTDLTPIEIMSWFMGPNSRNEETNSWKSLWSWCKILVMLVFAFKMEFFSCLCIHFNVLIPIGFKKRLCQWASRCEREVNSHHQHRTVGKSMNSYSAWDRFQCVCVMSVRRIWSRNHECCCWKSGYR